MSKLIGNDPIYTDHGDTFEAWTDGYAVGFKVTDPIGTVRYIFMNPSGGDDPATVFAYIGPNGDPSQDAAQHYYEITDGAWDAL